MGRVGEGKKAQADVIMIARVGSKRIIRHTQLDVYQLAFKAAMAIFHISKKFPREERYSLTDQIRRSSRSVCANLGEAWRKRRYEASFISKLSDSEGEAAETQVWIQFAVESEYLSKQEARQLYQDYDTILSQLVKMAHNSQDWTIK